MLELEPNEAVQVVEPEGKELGDSGLDKASGEFEFAPWLGGAAWGAAVGAGTQMIANRLQGKPLLQDVGRSAVIGSVSGAGTVTKGVIVVKKYASGLIEAGAKTAIDWSRTAVSTAKAFGTTIVSNWPWNKRIKRSRGGGGGW